MAREGVEVNSEVTSPDSRTKSLLSQLIHIRDVCHGKIIR